MNKLLAEDLTSFRKEFNEKCKAAFKDGLKMLAENENEKKYKYSPHSNFPTYRIGENGFPSLSTTSYGKINYSSLFTEDKRYLSIKSWVDLFDFLIKNQTFCKYYQIGTFFSSREIPESSSILFSEILIYHRIASLIRKYYTTNKTTDFHEGKFNALILQWFSMFTEESVSVHIYIPIILLKFDFDRFEVSENIFIERLNEELQLSRSTIKSYTDSYNDSVNEAATHAFVLKNWIIGNKTEVGTFRILQNFKSYKEAILIIDKLFASFRIELGIETGYSQIFAEPFFWDPFGIDELPSIYGAIKRNYPLKFEDFGWQSSVKIIKEEDCIKVKNIFLSLQKESKANFDLAIRRLNNAYLRETEEDSIIDIVIAMESLIIGQKGSEINYKMKMRVATLCKISPFEDYSQEKIFKEVGRIYDYRSNVVHGTKKRTASNKLDANNEEEIEIISFGQRLLRHIIKTLTEYPELQNPSEIDKLNLTIK